MPVVSVFGPVKDTGKSGHNAFLAFAYYVGYESVRRSVWAVGPEELSFDHHWQTGA